MRTLKDIFEEIQSVPDFFGHQIDSVNYKNDYGDTPLHVVANWGDCEAIELLLEAGADINSIGERGYTPLHCASEQNHPKAILLLLSVGAKIQSDDDGYSPIEIAQLLENVEAIKVLQKAQ